VQVEDAGLGSSLSLSLMLLTHAQEAIPAAALAFR
jgi:hypothetical protein